MSGTRPRLALAAALGLVIALTGCSDSDVADAAVSADQFCEEFNGFVGAAMSDEAGVVKAVKEWAAGMEDVGTPDEMPDDAQRGFAVFLDHAADLDEDMGIEDLQRLSTGLSEEEQADGEAFTTWVQDNCPVG